MRSAVARTSALLLALAAGACSTTDYSYARQTRGDRPYRGGAAEVPDHRPERPSTADSTAVGLGALAYLGAIVYACVHGGSFVGDSAWADPTRWPSQKPAPPSR